MSVFLAPQPTNASVALSAKEGTNNQLLEGWNFNGGLRKRGSSVAKSRDTLSLWEQVRAFLNAHVDSHWASALTCLRYGDAGKSRSNCAARASTALCLPKRAKAEIAINSRS